MRAAGLTLLAAAMLGGASARAAEPAAALPKAEIEKIVQRSRGA